MESTTLVLLSHSSPRLSPPLSPIRKVVFITRQLDLNYVNGDGPHLGGARFHFWDDLLKSVGGLFFW